MVHIIHWQQVLTVLLQDIRAHNQQSDKERNKEHSCWDVKFSTTLTFDRIKKWIKHITVHSSGSKRAFTPPPLLWKMVGFLMVSVWNKTDIWAFISHKRTGKIRLENNNKCRNLERLKWRPFFFIPHSFGVPAAAASTKTTACTKLMFVSYKTRLKLTLLLFFGFFQWTISKWYIFKQVLTLFCYKTISYFEWFTKN